MAKKELRFTIQNATPLTLPMSRLADYLTQLSLVLGSEDAVHFLRVDEGNSAVCPIVIDENRQDAVIKRAQSVSRGQGPKEATKAYKSLHSTLQQDDRSAELEWEDGEVILYFPLPAQKTQEVFGPFWQDGSVDGMLVMIGGIDETVPVHLLDEGGRHICNASREMAKSLAPYLFGVPIRVYGRGRWIRNAQGKWEMQWFDISKFEALEELSVPEIVSRLRSIPENDLMTTSNLLEEMRRVRYGEE